MIQKMVGIQICYAIPMLSIVMVKYICYGNEFGRFGFGLAVLEDSQN